MNAIFWFDLSFSLLILVRKCVRCNIFLVFFAKEMRFMPQIYLVFSLVTLKLFLNAFHGERELTKAVSSHNVTILKAVWLSTFRGWVGSPYQQPFICFQWGCSVCVCVLFTKHHLLHRERNEISICTWKVQSYTTWEFKIRPWTKLHQFSVQDISCFK